MKNTDLNQIVKNNLTALQNLDIKSVERIALEILSLKNSGGTLYLAGNGGSSSTASHFVNDITKATSKETSRPSIKVTCLTDNISLITAISNDISYDEIFRFQIDGNITDKDLLIVISASGNSENLVKAVDYCKSNGVKTIGFLGFDGGILLKKIDDYLLIKSNIGDYGLVENIHLTVCHMISEFLS
jgi:D-sedoheptulose 7-phosphate isomerase